MNISQVYISYKELAELLDISLDTVTNKVVPMIIEVYGIDTSKIAIRSSLPRVVVEEFFDYTQYLKKNKKSINKSIAKCLIDAV